MTGTPLQNNARELFNLLQFLDSSNDAAELEEKYAEMTNENIRELHEEIRPYILRRTKAQVLTFLPPLAQIIVPLSMSVLQKKLYRSILAKSPELLKVLFSSTELKQQERTGLSNILMQLRKCLCHPFVYNRDIEERTDVAAVSHRNLVEASAKLRILELLLPKLQERGHRVLIFSQFLHMLTILEDFLDGMALPFQRLDGTIGSLEKQKRIDQFNAPNSPLFAFLLSTRAGGVGINLATADTVIVLDPDWNPHQDIQAVSRAHRIGQKKKVLCFQLMTRASAEEKMIQMGRKKMALDHVVVEQLDADDIEEKDMASILRHGAAELFQDGDEHDIHYDDESIDKLLDRSQIENTKTGRRCVGRVAVQLRARVGQRPRRAQRRRRRARRGSRAGPQRVGRHPQAAPGGCCSRGACAGRGLWPRKADANGMCAVSCLRCSSDQTVDYKVPEDGAKSKDAKRDSDSDTDFQAPQSEDDGSGSESEHAAVDAEDLESAGAPKGTNGEIAMDTARVQQGPVAPMPPSSKPSFSVKIPPPPQPPPPPPAAGPRPTGPPLSIPVAKPALARPSAPPMQPSERVKPFVRAHVPVRAPVAPSAAWDLPTCATCQQQHPVGACALKAAGVEHCGLCGLAHFGFARTCPHINSEMQVREMLEALKKSPESKDLVDAATKYLRGVKGHIVQKKKRDRERAERYTLGVAGPPLVGNLPAQPALDGPVSQSLVATAPVVRPVLPARPLRPMPPQLQRQPLPTPQPVPRAQASARPNEAADDRLVRHAAAGLPGEVSASMRSLGMGRGVVGSA